MIRSLFQIFLWAGSEWVLWILVGLSALSLGVILERFRFLARRERLGRALWEEIGARWLGEGVPADWTGGAAEIARRFPASEGRLIALLARHANQPAAASERMAQSFLAAERARLEANLAILGTLGNAAPFIGLFGTVLGIIRAFYDLGRLSGGGAGLTAVSGGLAEALVTTAMGLLVAIPSAMAYNHFQRRIRAIQGRCVSLTGLLASRGGEE
jgi:biopolymer transport protein ExbB/TolQ